MHPSPRRLLAALAAGLLACKGGAKPAAGPITTKILLRYHPPAGAAYRYVLDQQSSVSPDTAVTDSGTGRNTMTLAFTQAIGTADADGVPVTTTLDSARVASPMLDAASAEEAARQLQGVRLSAVFDDRLHLVHHDFTALNRLPSIVGDQVQLGFRAAALPLPEQPMGPGDSWTNQVALPFGQIPGGVPLTATTKLTVRDIQRSGTDTTVRLAVETSFPDHPLRFAMGGQPITVTMRGAITGEQLFSLTRGAIVRASLGGTMRVDVRGAFFGPHGMVLRVDQQGMLRLVEPGEALSQ